MRSVRRLFSASSCLAAVLLLTAAAPLHAQTLDRSRYKNGLTVRKAFVSVVADVRRSTVVVLSDGKQTALGAIVDSSGHVITKASRLSGELTCRVGKETVEADLVGISREDDLAMLKLDVQRLQPVKWRQGKDPKVGQWLATPGGGELPVSVGVLSVKRRRIPPTPPLLGVSIDPEYQDEGARIRDLSRGGGAEKAGLKPGDIITWVAGKAVKNLDDLRKQIRLHRPGDSLIVKVRRQSEVKSFKARLGSGTNPNSRGAIQNRMGGNLSIRRMDFPTVLQHDSYLKPEECGGPIVDLNGNVIGINIARAGRTESYAIPTERVLSLLPKLKAGKLAPNNEQSTSTSEKKSKS